jgi:GntR family transcriptional regulator/MocR family aminotransferase
VTLVLSYAGVPEAALKRAGARLAEACLAVGEKFAMSSPQRNRRIEPASA